MPNARGQILAKQEEQSRAQGKTSVTARQDWPPGSNDNRRSTRGNIAHKKKGISRIDSGLRASRLVVTCGRVVSEGAGLVCLCG